MIAGNHLVARAGIITFGVLVDIDNIPAPAADGRSFGSTIIGGVFPVTFDLHEIFDLAQRLGMLVDPHRMRQANIRITGVIGIVAGHVAFVPGIGVIYLFCPTCRNTNGL